MSMLVVSIYLTIALFLIQLIFSCYNIQAFLIRQKKYKTTPLLIFYVLVILLTVAELLYTFFMLKLVMHDNIFVFILPVIKIEIGLAQCWILFELSLQIQKSIKQDIMIRENQLVSNDRTEITIKFGRIFLSLFISATLIFITIYL